MRIQVEWRDLDAAQHVNNAVYMAYLEDCGIQVSKAHGWSLERMSAEGFGILARRHHIEYRQPAVLEDELELTTWISNVKRTTATRHYTLARLRDQALLGQAHSLYVWVALETGKPIQIPAKFLADFAPNIVESG